MKLCTKCEAEKPLDEFHLDKGGRLGRYPWCKVCRKAHRETRRDHFREYGRIWQMARFGLTVADYERLLRWQDGKCAICKRPPERRRLDVDHCHKTKEVRGLLCEHCNKGIGMFRDDPSMLQAAAHYLTEKEV